MVLFRTIEDQMMVDKRGLTGPRRDGYFVAAREVFARIAREELELSLTRIGELLERDHTTIINLLKKHRVSDAVYQDTLAKYQHAINWHQK